MAKLSKNYKKIIALVDQSKTYSIDDAINLLLKTSTVKFDASVDIAVNLNINPKKADQLVRGSVLLPAGTGKKIRIAAFVKDDEAHIAEKAGADIAGITNLINKINKNEIDFDIAIAHPDVMKDIAKVAKILGPKGLMPSPKANTVTPHIEKTIDELKRGRIEFKNDAHGILHNTIGKLSFGPEKIKENLVAYLSAVKNAKPESIKNVYIKSVYISTTMGPSIKIDFK